MLDKVLCAAFGIDTYQQWLMAELDAIEDKLHSKLISDNEFLELKGKYDALLAARDHYCAFKKNNK